MGAEVTVTVEPGDRSVGPMLAADLDARLRSIERAHRMLAGLEAETVAQIDDRKLWRRDGHRSIRGLLRVITDDTPAEITAKTQLAALVAAHPQVTEDLLAGRYSTANARTLARAMAHPRAGEHFAMFFDVLRDSAMALSHPDLLRCVERWELLVDPDGANQDTRTIHDRRHATLAMVGQQFVLRAEGDALAGETITSIFQAFLRVEFDKDWAATIERHGDNACAALMPRTDSQRRFDALESIFLTAASTPPGAQRPEPVVNVVADPATVAAAVASVFGVDPADIETEPVDLMARRCETASGVPLSPEQLARVLLAGHIRRMVCDTNDVVINLGRRQRFFTGHARLAATLLHTRCVYAGCRVPVANCQVDHLHEWQHGGPTDQANAAPECDWHNLFKTNHHYRIARDRHGRYHTYRPDGTEVT